MLILSIQDEYIFSGTIDILHDFILADTSSEFITTTSHLLKKLNINTKKITHKEICKVREMNMTKNIFVFILYFY